MHMCVRETERETGGACVLWQVCGGHKSTNCAFQGPDRP